MNFVGLDLSFRGTGLTVLSESSEVFFQNLISTPAEECIEQRICFIYDKFRGVVQEYSPFLVFMEGLSFSSSGQATLDLAGLHFYIRVFMYENYPGEFYVIPPTTLKKYVTGTGRCQKNLMLLKTYKKFGVEFSDDNLCDSYCLARYGIDNYKKIRGI